MPHEEVVVEYEVRVPLDMARDMGERVREGRFSLAGTKQAWEAIDSVHRGPAECVVDLDSERGVAIPITQVSVVPDGCLPQSDINVPPAVATAWHSQGTPLLYHADEVERRGRTEPHTILISADGVLYMLTQHGLCVRCLPSIDSVTVSRDGWVQVSSPHNGAVLFRSLANRPFTLFSPVQVGTLNLTGAHSTQNMPSPVPPLACCPFEQRTVASGVKSAEGRGALLSIPSAAALRGIPQSDSESAVSSESPLVVPRVVASKLEPTPPATPTAETGVMFAAVLQWKSSEERRLRQGLVMVNRRALEVHGKASGPLRLPLQNVKVGRTANSVVASLPPQVAQVQGLPNSVSMQAHDAAEMDRLMLALESGEEEVPQSSVSDTASQESSVLPPPPALVVAGSGSGLKASNVNRQFVRTPGSGGGGGSGGVALPVQRGYPRVTTSVRPTVRTEYRTPQVASQQQSQSFGGGGGGGGSYAHNTSPSAPVFGHQNRLDAAPVPIFTRFTSHASNHDEDAASTPPRERAQGGIGGRGAHVSEASHRSYDDVLTAPVNVHTHTHTHALAQAIEVLLEEEDALRYDVTHAETAHFHNMIVKSTVALQHAAQQRHALTLHSAEVGRPQPQSQSQPQPQPQGMTQEGVMQLLRTALAIETGERDGREHIVAQHQDWLETIEEVAKQQRGSIVVSDSTSRSVALATTGPLKSFAAIPGAGSAMSGTTDDKAYRSGNAAAKHLISDEAIAHPSLDETQRQALRDGLMGFTPDVTDVHVGVKLAYIRGRRARSAMGVLAAASGAPPAFWAGISDGAHRGVEEWANGTLHGRLAPRPVAESGLPASLSHSSGLSAESAVIVAKLGEMGGGVAEVIWANSVNPPWAAQERWVLVVGVETLWLCSVDGSAAQCAPTASIRHIRSTTDGWVVLHLAGERDMLCRPLSEAALLVATLLRTTDATTERYASTIDSLLDSNALRAPPQPTEPLAVAPVKVVVGGFSKARTHATLCGVEAAMDLLNAEPPLHRHAFAQALMLGRSDDTPQGMRGVEARSVLRAIEPVDAFWEGLCAACEGALQEQPSAAEGTERLATVRHISDEVVDTPQTMQQQQPPPSIIHASADRGHVSPSGSQGEEWRETLHREVGIMRRQLSAEVQRLSPPRREVQGGICGVFAVRSGDGSAAEVSDERCELCLQLCAFESVPVPLLERCHTAVKQVADRDVLSVMSPLACARRGQPLLLAAQKVVHVGPSRSAHRILLISDTALYVVQGGEGRPCRVRRCLALEHITDVLCGADCSFGLAASQGLPVVLRVASKEQQEQLLEVLTPHNVQRKQSPSAAVIHSSLYHGSDAEGEDLLHPLSIACTGPISTPLRVINVPAMQLNQAAAAFATVPPLVEQMLGASDGHVAVLWGALGDVALSDDANDVVSGAMVVTPTAVTVLPLEGAPRSVPVTNVDQFIVSEDGWVGVASGTVDAAGVLFRPNQQGASEEALSALRRACGPARIRSVSVQHHANIGVSHSSPILIPVSVLLPGSPTRVQSASIALTPEPLPPPKVTPNDREGEQGRADRLSLSVLSGALIPPPVRVEVGTALRDVRVVELAQLGAELKGFFSVLSRMEGEAQVYWVGKAVPYTLPQGPPAVLAVFVTHDALFIAAGTGRVLRCTPLTKVNSLHVDGNGGVGIGFSGHTSVTFQCVSPREASELCHVLTLLCAKGLYVHEWDEGMEGTLKSDEPLCEVVLLAEEVAEVLTPVEVEVVVQAAQQPQHTTEQTPFRRAPSHGATTPQSSKPTWSEYKRKSSTLTSPQLRPLFEDERPSSGGRKKTSFEGVDGRVSSARPTRKTQSQSQSQTQTHLTTEASSGAVQLRAEISILQHVLKEQRVECDTVAGLARRSPRLQVTLEVAQAAVGVNAEILRILEAHAAGDTTGLAVSRSVTLPPTDLDRLQNTQAHSMAAHLAGEHDTVPLLHFAAMVTAYEVEGVGLSSRSAAVRQLCAVGDRALYLISTDTCVDRCIDLLQVTEVVYGSPQANCYVGVRIPSQWDLLVRCASFTEAVHLRLVLCNLCPGAGLRTLETDADFLDTLDRARPPDANLNEADLIKITYVDTPFLLNPPKSPAVVHTTHYVEETHGSGVMVPMVPLPPVDPMPEASVVRHSYAEEETVVASVQKPKLAWDRENALPCTAHAELPPKLASVVCR